MNLVAEIWKPVPGYEDYEVSQYGRIRSLKCGKVRVLKQTKKKPCRKGSKTVYLRVALTDRVGKIKQMRVHRAVLLAFMGPPPSEKHVASHIDGNSMNNWLLNLKWATQYENEADKELHGTKLIGTSVPNAKLHPAAVRRIRRLHASGWSAVVLKKLMSDLGVSRTTIRDVIRGRTWSHIV